MLKQAAEDEGEVPEAIASSHDDSDGESVLMHLGTAVLSLEKLSQKKKALRAKYKASTRELSLELSALEVDLDASSRMEAADATRQLQTARRELEQTKIADSVAKLDAEKENQAMQSELSLLNKSLEMSKLKLKETEEELARWRNTRVKELNQQYARELDAKDEIIQRRVEVHQLLMKACLKQNQRNQWRNKLQAEYLEMKECSKMRKSELLQAEKAVLEAELHKSSLAARRNAEQKNSLEELYASMRNWILLDADKVRNKRPAGAGDTWEVADVCSLWDTYAFDDSLQNLLAEMFIQADVRFKDNNFDPNWLFGDVDLRSQLWKISYEAGPGYSWMRPTLGAEKWLKSTSCLDAEEAAFWLKRRRQTMRELKRLCDSVNPQQATRLEPLLDRVRKALAEDDCVQFDRQYLEWIKAR